MVDASKRQVKPGTGYDRYFRKPGYRDELRVRNATVDHSIDYIAARAYQVTDQVKRISQELKGGSIRESCRNIFDFIMDYIAYERDEWGKEQVKDPVRLWADRKGDCDCYTLFMSSILLVLKVPHRLKVTGYTSPDSLEHIYVVATDEQGEQIAIDPVVGQFDYEHRPIVALREIPMGVNILEGLFGGYGNRCALACEPGKTASVASSHFQPRQPATTAKARQVPASAEQGRPVFPAGQPASGSQAIARAVARQAAPALPKKQEKTVSNRWAWPLATGLAALTAYIIF